MEHTTRLNLLQGAEARLHIPHSLFARWLVEHGRLTDAMPEDVPLVVLVPRLGPERQGCVRGLWKHSRE